MRLFVACEVAAPVKTAAVALIEELAQRASRLAPSSRITWVTADRLHVTVRFIGFVDDTRAASIRAALSGALPVSAFDLAVGGVGAFPPKGPPRVLWAGLTLGTDRLVDVERHVSTVLARVGIASEARPYAPHLTLARVREAAGLRTAALLEGRSGTMLGTTRVGAITLFESRLSPAGPQYQVMQQMVVTEEGAQ